MSEEIQKTARSKQGKDLTARILAHTGGTDLRLEGYFYITVTGDISLSVAVSVIDANQPCAGTITKLPRLVLPSPYINVAKPNLISKNLVDALERLAEEVATNCEQPETREKRLKKLLDGTSLEMSDELPEERDS